MDKGNFTPDPELIKEGKNLQKKREELLFMSLCSDLDLELVLNEREMSIKDFERLTYLITRLGLQNYCLSFENQHSDLLQTLGSQIEHEVITESADIESDLQLRTQWEDAFLKNLPTKKMKSCIKEIFELSI